jgi:hypothetical protein
MQNSACRTRAAAAAAASVAAARCHPQRPDPPAALASSCSRSCWSCLPLSPRAKGAPLPLVGSSTSSPRCQTPRRHGRGPEEICLDRCIADGAAGAMAALRQTRGRRRPASNVRWHAHGTSELARGQGHGIAPKIPHPAVTTTHPSVTTPSRAMQGRPPSRARAPRTATVTGVTASAPDARRLRRRGRR